MLLVGNEFTSVVRADALTTYQARHDAEALRPKAERLVERLFRELKDAPKVVAAVRADRSLNEAQRQAALRAVLRRSARSD